ncbi:hypothetical protein ACXDF8_10800 [Mycolicibacterium sp. CBM1]
MLLPIMVVLDVSWPRATVALAVIAGTFAVEIYTDPVMRAQIGFAPMTLATAIFVVLCCTVSLAVYAQGRKLDEIARLSASRQALLVDITTASDEQQRTVSEFLHDGPLQSVLMARQDITSVLKRNPDDALERALAGLREATDQMRQAHVRAAPGRARRCGSGSRGRAVGRCELRALGYRHQYRHRLSADRPGRPDRLRRGPRVVVQRRAAFPRDQGRCDAAGRRRRLSSRRGRRGRRGRRRDRHLPDAAADRLCQGHIELASQRARIEAAGGTLRILDVPHGAHVRVTVPLTRPA